MGKLKSQAVTTLRIGLFDPGLTAVLRAGLGGLAAAVHAIGPNALEKLGTIMVEPDAITLDWREPGAASGFFEQVFADCFRVTDGLIDLAGSHQDDPRLEVRVAMTDALRLTFLQHGSSANKAGAASACTFEIDDQARQVLVQP